MKTRYNGYVEGSGHFYLPTKSRYSALKCPSFDKIGKAQDGGSLGKRD